MTPDARAWPGGEGNPFLPEWRKAAATPAWEVTTSDVEKATGVRITPGVRIDWTVEHGRVRLHVLDSDGTRLGSGSIRIADLVGGKG